MLFLQDSLLSVSRSVSKRLSSVDRSDFCIQNDDECREHKLRQFFGFLTIATRRAIGDEKELGP